MDARDLNNAIKRPHHPLPVIEDILGDLANAKVFSVVDVKNGFWHVELTKESSLLTTINPRSGDLDGCGCLSELMQQVKNSSGG